MADIVLREGMNELNVSLTPIYVPPVVAHMSWSVSDASTGYPIEGVKATFGGVVKYTDAEGLCAFLDIVRGTYTLSFEKEGYEPAGYTVIF